MIIIFFLQLNYLNTIYTIKDLLFEVEAYEYIIEEDLEMCIIFFEKEEHDGRFELDEFSGDMAAAITQWEENNDSLERQETLKSVFFPFQFPETMVTRLDMPPEKTYFLKYFKHPALTPEYNIRKPISSVAMEVCGNYFVHTRLTGENCRFPLLYAGAFKLNNYTTFYMVYDLGHCDLHYYARFLAKNRFLQSEKADLVIRKLLRTAVYLQQQNLAHADIKLENAVLVCENGEPIKKIDPITVWKCDPEQLFVKFIDFECARRFPYPDSNPCDTPAYRAPELFCDWVPTLESETWSLAISIVYFFTNKTSSIFSDEFEFFRYIEFISGESIIEELEEFCRNKFPSDLQSFESKKKRGDFKKDKNVLDWEEKISNRSLLDLVKKMLRINPKKRINFEDIKEHPFFKQEETVEVSNREEEDDE